MASLVIVQKRRRAERAKQAQDKHIENQKFIKQVLEEHDKSKTGTLSFEEVRDWLSSIAQGEVVTDDEVKWIMVMANEAKKNEEGSREPASPQARPIAYETAQVEPQYFETALESWLGYRQTKGEIDGIFSLFDTDNSQTLDRTQLANVLEKLNEGVPPTDVEVMKEADAIGNGVISKPELCKAIALWYNMEEQTIVQDAEEAQRQPKPGTSGCCSLQ